MFRFACGTRSEMPQDRQYCAQDSSQDLTESDPESENAFDLLEVQVPSYKIENQAFRLQNNVFDS